MSAARQIYTNDPSPNRLCCCMHKPTSIRPPIGEEIQGLHLGHHEMIQGLAWWVVHKYQRGLG